MSVAKGLVGGVLGSTPLGLIGGAIGSSLLGGIGANKAAKTQQQGFQYGEQQAGKSINAGYDDALKYLSPYTQFGEQVLPYLQQYLQQKPFSYEDYFGSKQYADLSAAENERVARQAQAGIGVRSGQGQQALAAIAPQLAMQERAYQDQANQQRFGNLFNLAQFGGGFAQNAANMGFNRGQSLADYQYNAATGGAGARAQGQNAMFGGLGQIAGDVGTLFGANQLGVFDRMMRDNQQGGQPVNIATYQAPTYFTNRYP